VISSRNGEQSISVPYETDEKIQPEGFSLPYNLASGYLSSSSRQSGLLTSMHWQSSPWITFLDCLAASLTFHLFITFRDHRRRRGLPYPPGPPSLPVIGNLLDVPKRSAWVAYHDMSKTYGRRQHSRDPDSLIVSWIRRHYMSPYFWTSGCGAIFSTLYQRPLGETWGKVRRPAHVANPGNVSYTRSLSPVHLAFLTPLKIQTGVGLAHPNYQGERVLA
jgi:hypothetical protein